MADADDIAALRREVEELRTRVDSLDTELRAARGRVDLTMRNQQRCRACGNRKIAHALSVLDRADNDARAPLALNRPSWWSSKVQGELEAFVCMACGLVEWWVKEPDSLKPHEDWLAIIDDGGESGGPYR